MTVTVEPGCSWAALRAALAPLGLRTPFWGPMSGLRSTVVLGDGQVLRTGARGAGGDKPFFRHYGPDLSGLFCGDGGALGIKAAITLRLMASPAHEDYASFAFQTGRELLSAMAAMARAGIACEMCAFDPGLTRVRMQRSSLASDVKTLGAVVGRQKSLVKGLLEAGKIALAGRDFVGEENYSLHLIAESRSAAGVQADIAEAVFYWPGERLAVHAAAMQPEHLAKLPALPDDPAATQLVVLARKRLMALFQRFGCGHFQIGRTYPYRQSRDAASWQLVEAIKTAVDPSRVLNPGVLGLGSVLSG
jgi:FAD/FMN-containing dehydrogenase